MRLQNSSGSGTTPPIMSASYDLEAKDGEAEMTSAGKTLMSRTTAKTSEGPAFDYINDKKYSYTLKEAADKISAMTGKTVTAADLQEKMPNKQSLNDQDMFRLLDLNRDGKATAKEMEMFTMNGNASGGFNYLKDATGSYTAADTAKILSEKTGVLISEAQVKRLFGKDNVTDADLLRIMDGATGRDGSKDAMIGKGEVLKKIYGADLMPASPPPFFGMPGMPGMPGAAPGTPPGIPFPMMMEMMQMLAPMMQKMFGGMSSPGAGMPGMPPFGGPGQSDMLKHNPFFSGKIELAETLPKASPAVQSDKMSETTEAEETKEVTGGKNEDDGIRFNTPVGFSIYITPPQTYPGPFGSPGMRGVTNGNIKPMIEE